MEKSLLHYQFWKRNIAGQSLIKLKWETNTSCLKENGAKGAYNFMKLPYHQFHRDYQPDGMHTVTDVVKPVMN